MKWYLAKLVYRIICGDGNHTPQFDEQIRLIQAEDEFHAFQKARTLGHKEEDSFLNCVNKPVRWKFIDVSDLQPVTQMIDGAEIYSRITEEDDADAFTKVTYLKATHLHENFAQQVVRLN